MVRIRIEVLVGGGGGSWNQEKSYIWLLKFNSLLISSSVEMLLSIYIFICSLFWFQSRILQNLLVNMSAGYGGRLIVLEIIGNRSYVFFEVACKPLSGSGQSYIQKHYQWATMRGNECLNFQSSQIHRPDARWVDSLRIWVNNRTAVLYRYENICCLN